MQEERMLQQSSYKRVRDRASERYGAASILELLGKRNLKFKSALGGGAAEDKSEIQEMWCCSW